MDILYNDILREIALHGLQGMRVSRLKKYVSNHSLLDGDESASGPLLRKLTPYLKRHCRFCEGTSAHDVDDDVDLASAVLEPYICKELGAGDLPSALRTRRIRKYSDVDDFVAHDNWVVVAIEMVRSRTYDHEGSRGNLLTCREQVPYQECMDGEELLTLEMVALLDRLGRTRYRGLNTSEIAKVLQVRVPTVKQNIAVLKNRGLIRNQRQDKSTPTSLAIFEADSAFHTIDPAHIQDATDLIKATVQEYHRECPTETDSKHWWPALADVADRAQQLLTPSCPNEAQLAVTYALKDLKVSGQFREPVAVQKDNHYGRKALLQRVPLVYAMPDQYAADGSSTLWVAPTSSILHAIIYVVHYMHRHLGQEYVRKTDVATVLGIFQRKHEAFFTHHIQRGVLGVREIQAGRNLEAMLFVTEKGRKEYGLEDWNRSEGKHADASISNGIKLKTAIDTDDGINDKPDLAEGKIDALIQHIVQRHGAVDESRLVAYVQDVRHSTLGFSLKKTAVLSAMERLIRHDQIMKREEILHTKSYGKVKVETLRDMTRSATNPIFDARAQATKERVAARVKPPTASDLLVDVLPSSIDAAEFPTLLNPSRHPWADSTTLADGGPPRWERVCIVHQLLWVETHMQRAAMGVEGRGEKVWIDLKTWITCLPLPVLQLILGHADDEVAESLQDLRDQEKGWKILEMGMGTLTSSLFILRELALINTEPHPHHAAELPVAVSMVEDVVMTQTYRNAFAQVRPRLRGHAPSVGQRTGQWPSRLLMYKQSHRDAYWDGLRALCCYRGERKVQMMRTLAPVNKPWLISLLGARNVDGCWDRSQVVAGFGQVDRVVGAAILSASVALSNVPDGAGEDVEEIRTSILEPLQGEKEYLLVSGLSEEAVDHLITLILEIILEDLQEPGRRKRLDQKRVLLRVLTKQRPQRPTWHRTVSAHVGETPEIALDQEEEVVYEGYEVDEDQEEEDEESEEVTEAEEESEPLEPAHAQVAKAGQATVRFMSRADQEQIMRSPELQAITYTGWWPEVSSTTVAIFVVDLVREALKRLRESDIMNKSDGGDFGMVDEEDFALHCSAVDSLLGTMYGVCVGVMALSVDTRTNRQRREARSQGRSQLAKRISTTALDADLVEKLLFGEVIARVRRVLLDLGERNVGDLALLDFIELRVEFLLASPGSVQRLTANSSLQHILCQTAQVAWIYGAHCTSDDQTRVDICALYQRCVGQRPWDPETYLSPPTGGNLVPLTAQDRLKHVLAWHGLDPDDDLATRLCAGLVQAWTTGDQSQLEELSPTERSALLAYALASGQYGAVLSEWKGSVTIDDKRIRPTLLQHSHGTNEASSEAKAAALAQKYVLLTRGEVGSKSPLPPVDELAFAMACMVDYSTTSVPQEVTLSMTHKEISSDVLPEPPPALGAMDHEVFLKLCKHILYLVGDSDDTHSVTVQTLADGPLYGVLMVEQVAGVVQDLRSRDLLALAVPDRDWPPTYGSLGEALQARAGDRSKRRRTDRNDASTMEKPLVVTDMGVRFLLSQ
eukprot:Clim_evm38s44 gene=Clim_evmTU38s44